jgi:hypothetical protein
MVAETQSIQTPYPRNKLADKESPVIVREAFDALRSLEMGTADLMEEAISKLPIQLEPDIRHHFAPGIYYREIHMPKGAFVLGKIHKTDHLNVISCGKAIVSMNGATPQLVVGPCVIRSGAGVQKMLLILEDTVWATVHTNDDNESDLDILEDRYTEHHVSKISSGTDKIKE